MSWLGYMSVISSKDETGSSPLVFKNETKLLKAFLNGKAFFLLNRKERKDFIYGYAYKRKVRKAL
ncbi:hypothetical protein SAMN05443663_101576 [Flavobacterium defluvii]|uniref:Uncharacterized protein n=1 Tax=Flavobacterium defluvii TaxID=370979 RepID=A0A1M5FSI3_9FLAO|nr:hypothetical protein SAMN05443663_101576 [Flavobacterium defluvii]